MKSVTKPVRDGAAEGRTGDWGEVVTRYPYENVDGSPPFYGEIRKRRKEEPYEILGDGAKEAKRFHIEG